VESNRADIKHWKLCFLFSILCCLHIIQSPTAYLSGWKTQRNVSFKREGQQTLSPSLSAAWAFALS
jgi:hypothetical protein